MLAIISVITVIYTMFLTSLYSSVSSSALIFPYFVAFLGPVKLHDDSYTAVNSTLPRLSACILMEKELTIVLTI